MIQIPALAGINSYLPARGIEDTQVSYGKNVIFERNVMRLRYGIEPMSLGLSGEIKGIISYRQANEKEVVAILTTRDAYYWDQATGQTHLITPRYSTGTVSTTSGNTTCTGTSTEWKMLNGSPSYFKIGFGTTDPESVTTWYDIASIESNTSLTLLSNADANRVDVSYVIKQCFHMNEDDHWSMAPVYCYEYGEVHLYLANGNDPLRKWTGHDTETLTVNNIEEVAWKKTSATWSSGSTSVTVDDSTGIYQNMEPGINDGGFSNLVDGSGDPVYVASVDHSTDTVTLNAQPSTSDTDADLWWDAMPPVPKHIHHAGSVGYEHLMIANLDDDGTLYPAMMWVANAGEPDNFQGTHYHLLDTEEAIEGIKDMRGKIHVFKRRSITEMWPDPSGGNTDPFNFTQSKRSDIGTENIRSVISFSDYLVTFSPEGIYQYDGVQKKDIGLPIFQGILDEMFQLDIGKFHAFAIKADSLYALCISEERGYPDVVWVYNYVFNTWSRWEMPIKISCVGNYTRTETPRVEDYQSGEKNSFSMSGTLTSGSTVVTGLATGSLSVGMEVTGTGIPSSTYIDSIDSASQITMDKDATASGSQTLEFLHTVSSLGGRVEDYIIEDNNKTLLFGTADGNIYAVKRDTHADYLTVGNATDIDASVKSKDFFANDPYNTIKLLKILLGLRANSGYIRIRVSVDHGHSWGEWVSLDQSGIGTFEELTANFFARGRSVMFEIQNVDGSFFELENIIMGYNDSGEVQ